MVSMLGTVTIREDIGAVAETVAVKDFAARALGDQTPEINYWAQRSSNSETSGGQPYLMGRTTVPSPRVT
jgi:hypothetical protein